MKIIGGIHAIDSNSATVVTGVAIDPRRLEEAGNGLPITRRDGVLQGMPGGGAVHGAGIYVIEPDLLRELARDAALAGRGGAIDGNDSVSGRGVHSKSACRCFRKITGSLSAVATPAACSHALILRLPWRV